MAQRQKKKFFSSSEVIICGAGIDSRENRNDRTLWARLVLLEVQPERGQTLRPHLTQNSIWDRVA